MSAASPPDQEPRRGPPPGRGGGLRVLAIGFAIALAAAFLFERHFRAEAAIDLAEKTHADIAAPPAVDVISAGLAPAKQSLTLPGETAAWDETPIYARVNGYVAKWLVDIGDHVKAGDTLAMIDTPELDAELNAAKAKLNASVAQVAVKQAQADFAKTTEERWRDSPKGVVSDQERESKKAGSAEAIADLNAARAQVQLQQAEVDRLTALTAFKTVRAPFGGTIVERRIDTGNLVTAGSAANTSALYRLAQDDPLRVFVHAPQSVAEQLMRSETKVDVLFGDQPDARFEGKVARTARALDPQSRTLRVEIDVPNARHALVPGMFVRARFALDGGGRVQIPAAALLFRSQGPQVAVVDDKGAVAFRPVTIASDDGATVTIGSGVEAGEAIALNLSSQIASGQIVKANRIDDDTRSASSAP